MIMITLNQFLNTKRIIFCIDMQWESCSIFNLEQLSLSLSRANIASFVNNLGTQVSFATAELAIFAPDMLWESWSKFILEQLSYSTNERPQVNFCHERWNECMV